MTAPRDGPQCELCTVTDCCYVTEVSHCRNEHQKVYIGLGNRFGACQMMVGDLRKKSWKMELFWKWNFFLDLLLICDDVVGRETRNQLRPA